MIETKQFSLSMSIPITIELFQINNQMNVWRPEQSMQLVFEVGRFEYQLAAGEKHIFICIDRFLTISSVLGGNTDAPVALNLFADANLSVQFVQFP